MTRPSPVALATLALLSAALAVPHGAPLRAQVVRPPNIQGPIKAAKSAAAKTNEQTKAAEKAGGTQPQAAAPTQKSASAPQKSASAPQKTGSKARARGDTGSGTVVQTGARRGQVVVMREVFTYSPAARRDPFVSLMLSGELRPILTDLVLTGVVFDDDPRGRRSVAILVDASTGQSYRVRVGQTLGRMTVTRIGRENITFSIDEFGLSRSETLIINKASTAGPTPAPRRPQP